MVHSNFLHLYTSILYRCGQKYYDKQLLDYEINGAQLLFLILIYEQEGIHMQQLAQVGCFDKGTITKSIRRLEELGYVTTTASIEDKRIRLLYTTDKTKDIIRDLYFIRQQWWETLTNGIPQNELSSFEKTLRKLCDNAKEQDEQNESKIKIFGFQKLSLLDYPQKIACTIFTGGCNFRCPFCHNSDLVFLPENMPEVDEDELFSYLRKRKGILEGVCISGGEPLLNPELNPFLSKIKSLGYPIKLDTNGSNPTKLKELVELNLIDYVAMDVKNTPQKYAETTGIPNIDIQPILESIQYLKEGNIPYEFRTTIVKEYHTIDDIKEMAVLLSGAENWYLQNFKDGNSVIQKGLHSWDTETLNTYADIAKTNIPHVELRGI